MARSIIKVDGMSCEHCVKAITTAVSMLPGVDEVAVELGAKTVTIGYDPEAVTLDKIKLEIEEQGYDIVL